MIQKHLYKCLSQDTALAALCAERIYPNIAEQGIAEPHIVYQQISRPVEYLSTGHARGRVNATYDIRCFGRQGIQSPNYKQAHTVAAAARSALERVQGQTLDDGSVLLGATISNVLDLYDDKAQWHYVVISAQLQYCEEP